MLYVSLMYGVYVADHVSSCQYWAPVSLVNLVTPVLMEAVPRLARLEQCCLSSR